MAAATYPNAPALYRTIVFFLLVAGCLWPIRVLQQFHVQL